MRLAYAQTKPPEKINCSCIATNHPFDVVNAKSKVTEEVEDWRVSCTISRGEKVLYGPKELTLPYPESYEDAMAAIKVFRTKTAAEIIKKEKHSEENR